MFVPDEEQPPLPDVPPPDEDRDDLTPSDDSRVQAFNAAVRADRLRRVLAGEEMLDDVADDADGDDAGDVRAVEPATDAPDPVPEPIRRPPPDDGY